MKCGHIFLSPFSTQVSFGVVSEMWTYLPKPIVYTGEACTAFVTEARGHVSSSVFSTQVRLVGVVSEVWTCVFLSPFSAQVRLVGVVSEVWTCVFLNVLYAGEAGWSRQ